MALTLRKGRNGFLPASSALVKAGGGPARQGAARPARAFRRAQPASWTLPRGDRGAPCAMRSAVHAFARSARAPATGFIGCWTDDRLALWYVVPRCSQCLPSPRQSKSTPASCRPSGRNASGYARPSSTMESTCAWASCRLGPVWPRSGRRCGRSNDITSPRDPLMRRNFISCACCFRCRNAGRSAAPAAAITARSAPPWPIWRRRCWRAAHAATGSPTSPPPPGARRERRTGGVLGHVRLSGCERRRQHLNWKTGSRIFGPLASAPKRSPIPVQATYPWEWSRALMCSHLPNDYRGVKADRKFDHQQEVRHRRLPPLAATTKQSEDWGESFRQGGSVESCS